MAYSTDCQRYVHDQYNFRIKRNFYNFFGYPKYLISDNGKTFVATEFKKFLENHSIQLKPSAPYHLATNGQAERFVQTLKLSLKCINSTGTNLRTSLQEMLMQYRTMPHTTTRRSPFELFLGRQIRNRLQLVIPEKEKEKVLYSSSRFKDRERVSCRNYSGSIKWKFGRITRRIREL